MDQAALQKAIQTSIDHTAVLLDAHRSLHDGKIPPEMLPDWTALLCRCEVEASTSESVTLAAKEHIRSMDDLNLKNQLAALRCDAPKTAAEPAQQLVAAYLDPAPMAQWDRPWKKRKSQHPASRSDSNQQSRRPPLPQQLILVLVRIFPRPPLANRSYPCDRRHLDSLWVPATVKKWERCYSPVFRQT